MASLPPALQQRLDLWLRERLPRQDQITLDQRRIFIVPSKLSLAMLALVALMFLLGNLFQNTMAYTVSFWLLALQVISIFYTYRNFSGLRIEPAGADSAFAGERARFRFRVSQADGRPAHNLVIGWRDQDACNFDLDAGEQRLVQLSHEAPTRGWLQAQKLEIQTRYPTGLALAWSYLRFEQRALIYPAPAPEHSNNLQQDSHDSDDEGQARSTGVSDFAGVQDYRPGDSPRRIHWAKYAQTGELYTKTFEDNLSPERWLQWSELRGDTESRLSQLCALVLEAHEQKLRFGLRLPGQEIAPGAGDSHREACLRALALHALDDGDA